MRAKEKIDRLKDITFAPCKSRNDGLISVTQEGMDETRQWEEGRVNIDIGKMSVDFCVLVSYTKDEFEEEMEDAGDPIPNLDTIDFDFSNIPFCRVDELTGIIEGHPNGVICNGDYIQWIE